MRRLAIGIGMLLVTLPVLVFGGAYAFALWAAAISLIGSAIARLRRRHA